MYATVIKINKRETFIQMTVTKN